MKEWKKPELSELSVKETLVGIINELAESEPSGFTTGADQIPVLGNS